MEIRAKHFEYWVTIDEGGSISADGNPVEAGTDVSAEHLLLAGLARCSISSLAHFAGKRDLTLSATAYAAGTVTLRADDDRYGFTDFECRIEVDLSDELPDEDLRPLLDSAEWGCFVGASLDPPPRYKWRVNGRDL